MPSRESTVPASGNGFAAECAAAALAVRRGHGGSRVLLAEDQPLNRELYVKLLEAAGLQVEAVSSGAIALKLARHRHFDLVLTDLQLSELDGLQLARGIRALPGAAAQVPIIAVTAAEEGSVRPECQSAGIQDVMHKPMTPIRLYAVVESALGGHATARRPAQAETRPLPLGIGIEHLDPKLIDAVQGLAFFAGHTDSYMRALRAFALERQGGLKSFPAPPESDDVAASDQAWRQRVQREVHGIGGVAAAIGALPVMDHARRIENELQAGLPAAPLHQSLARMNHDLIALAEHLAAQFDS